MMMMTGLTALDVQQNKSVLQVWLNRPAARNSLSATLVSELDGLFTGLASRPDVRTVVLRGRGGHFCAGADLKEMAEARAAGADGVGSDPFAVLNRALGTLLQRVEAAPQVVVAVCEGAVLGGGLGLACTADITLVEADAQLGLPELTLGLPPAQIALFLVARLGLSQARRLALTGARFDGRQAAALGIAHAAYAGTAALEQGLAETLAAIARCAPGAIATTKQLLRTIGTVPTSALLDQAAALFAAAARGDEAAEGAVAFAEKRKPRWNDWNDPEQP
ncbi:MAG: isohexenylglutaconyl-CoA hydratase [Myxococcales bacterium]|jgi:isohexenylglutaconyl-CoA hydratase|nr:isohexenylglutaconyl-CoA hydratase [Myxococcales bacterium]